jgi:hypothetical protein
MRPVEGCEGLYSVTECGYDFKGVMPNADH